jgi:two-component system sensor histidine kinase EvgS
MHHTLTRIFPWGNFSKLILKNKRIPAEFNKFDTVLMQFMVKSQTMQENEKKSAHILVIDDDDAIQGILSMALESEGYQVTSAFSAIEALEILKKDPMPYDLLLLDLYMPNMNGLEFAERLKIEGILETKKIPIVVSSATNRASEKEAAGKFDHFLPKPFDLKMLFDVCERLTKPSV